jgi:hypothetical protein
MSRDFRSAVKEAAPEPRLQLDERDLARRARRVSVTRLLALLVGLAVVGTGAWGVASVRPSSPGDTATHGNRAPEIPSGPRHEVISGRFGEDWEGSDAGKTWRLLVWGEGHTHCWQLAVEAAEPNHGLACTAPSSKSAEVDHLGGWMSFFTGSKDPEQFWFTAGETGPDVESLQFRIQDGESIEIPLRDAPPESGLELHYYAVTLPRFDYATLVALDADGEVLDSDDICGPGCRQDRKEETEAKIAEFEAQPVTTESKAAGFANIAVGRAGLMDPFATLYRYRGVEERGDGFAALFDVSECEPPHGQEGTYSCGGDMVRATVVVEVSGDHLIVQEADGPMNQTQRQLLLAYTHSVDDFGPRWRRIAASIVREQDRPAWGLAYSLVWMGDVPPPVGQYGSMCSMVVYDGGGDVVYERQGLPAMVDREEESRVQMLLTGLEAEVSDPQDVVVECDDPRANFMNDR